MLHILDTSPLGLNSIDCHVSCLWSLLIHGNPWGAEGHNSDRKCFSLSWHCIFHHTADSLVQFRCLHLYANSFSCSVLLEIRIRSFPWWAAHYNRIYDPRFRCCRGSYRDVLLSVEKGAEEVLPVGRSYWERAKNATERVRTSTDFEFAKRCNHGYKFRQENRTKPKSKISYTWSRFFEHLVL